MRLHAQNSTHICWLTRFLRSLPCTPASGIFQVRSRVLPIITYIFFFSLEIVSLLQLCFLSEWTNKCKPRTCEGPQWAECCVATRTAGIEWKNSAALKRLEPGRILNGAAQEGSTGSAKHLFQTGHNLRRIYCSFSPTARWKEERDLKIPFADQRSALPPDSPGTWVKF